MFTVKFVSRPLALELTTCRGPICISYTNKSMWTLCQTHTYLFKRDFPFCIQVTKVDDRSTVPKQVMLGSTVPSLRQYKQTHFLHYRISIFGKWYPLPQPLPQYIGPTTYSRSAWWLSEGCILPTFPQAILWGAQRYPSWWRHTPTEHQMLHGSMRMWLHETVHYQSVKGMSPLCCHLMADIGITSGKQKTWLNIPYSTTIS